MIKTKEKYIKKEMSFREKYLCRIGKIKLLSCDENVKKYIQKALDLPERKSPTLYQCKKMLLAKKALYVGKADYYSKQQIVKIDDALNYLRLVKMSKEKRKRNSVIY